MTSLQATPDNSAASGNTLEQSTRAEELLRVYRKLHESPRAKERALEIELELAKQQPEVAKFLEDFYLEGDREAALARFLRWHFPQDVVDTLRHFYGDKKDIAICEVGAGNGFLSAALVRSGYTDVDILEPANDRIAGTGFFRDLPEAARVRIYNDEDQWYRSAKKYDVILTNACIHHFSNPAFVATQIRLKTKDYGRWLAFVEYFSADFEDTATQINTHRHAVLYNLYEWPYSVRLYAAMLASAAFTLKEVAPVIPHGRRGKRAAAAIWTRLWRAFCALGLSRAAYALLFLSVRLLARSFVRRIDPQYMMFQARPIRWQLIRDGYRNGADVE